MCVCFFIFSFKSSSINLVLSERSKGRTVNKIDWGGLGNFLDWISSTCSVGFFFGGGGVGEGRGGGGEVNSPAGFFFYFQFFSSNLFVAPDSLT